MQSKQHNRKPWPANCKWPEPLYDGTGDLWEDDLACMLPLDEDAEALLDIKAYFDSLIEDGLLLEDYSLDPDYFEENGEDPEDWAPEEGEIYWSDGCFLLEAWEDDFSDTMNLLKLDTADFDPASFVRQAIGYEFINENLLRQAFTRRAFALEHQLSGCSEELEFLGDAVLTQIVSKELLRQLSAVEKEHTDAPLQMQREITEGSLSKLREGYVCREALAKRAVELELDQLILYGSGEVLSEAAQEDALEALIGAVALDSGWDWDAIEGVVDRLVCVQKEYFSEKLRESCYDRLNAWHQRQFGQIPSYETSGRAPTYHCTLRYFIPENDKDLHREQRIDTDGAARSEAREKAAKLACTFLDVYGLWFNLADAEMTPSFENSINQLQGLFQKKYLPEPPTYTFEQLSAEEWRCVCTCGEQSASGIGVGKTKAKKAAAFQVLNRLFEGTITTPY